MANNERVRKVVEQIKREMVSIIPSSTYHPKATLISITGIDLSRDFKYATIFVTLIGPSDDRDEIVEVLNKRSGKIRQLLSKRMMTRTVPAMKFKYDDSVEYGAKMENILKDLVEEAPDDGKDSKEDGGLSGLPLRQKSNEVISYLAKELDGEIPIIAVGGIMDADDAAEKIELGASLVQIYTGFIYSGPNLIKSIVKKITWVIN